MSLPGVMLLINLAATCFMAGLIWFVQVVHYPLFARVGAAEFCDFHRRHTRMTTRVVAPVMLLELASAVAMVMWAPMGVAPIWPWLGLGLLVIIWASTAVIQVPCHTRLSRGLDTAMCSRLCRTNWIRTIGWTLRAALLLALSTAALR